LINLSGVYHHGATGATAECMDLFGSSIYRREKAPKEPLVEPDVFHAPIVAKNPRMPQHCTSKRTLCAYDDRAVEWPIPGHLATLAGRCVPLGAGINSHQ
jgi:hypothetical protein